MLRLRLVLIASGLLTGTAAGQLAITTPSPLTAGIFRCSYGYTVGMGGNLVFQQRVLLATGGAPPYQFQVSAGALPQGIVLNANGNLTGIPTVPGNSQFTARVTDANLATATKLFTISVQQVLQRSGSGIVGSSMVVEFADSPATHVVVSGTLAPGLAPGAGNVAFLGVPTQAGEYRLFHQATVSSGVQYFDLLLFIRPIGRLAIPPGVVGEPYRLDFEAVRESGQTPPITYSVTSGALPPGFTFSPEGVLSGTPQQAGTYHFVGRATEVNPTPATAVTSGDITLVILGAENLAAASALPCSAEGTVRASPDDQPPSSVLWRNETTSTYRFWPIDADGVRLNGDFPNEIGPNQSLLYGSFGSLQPYVLLDSNGACVGIYVVSGGPLVVRIAQQAQPIRVEPNSLSFSAASGAAAFTGAVALSVDSGPAQDITVTAASQGNWLSATPQTGRVSAGALTTIELGINPGSLAVGTYTGTVTVRSIATGATSDVVVTLAIAAGRRFSLSQSGFSFQVAAGSTLAQTGDVAVLAQGAGDLAWTASTTGGAWLTLSAASGTANTNGPLSGFQIRANPTGLAAGDYYGQVRVDSAVADNSPQLLTVVLGVTSGDVRLTVSPAGVSFVAAVGGADPAARSIRLANAAGVEMPFEIRLPSPPPTWLTVTPATGSVPVNQAVNPTLTARIAGLAAGVYRTEIAVNTNPPGPIPDVTQNVDVLLVVTQPAGEAVGREARAATCVPQRLLPQFVTLGNGYLSVGDWPAALQVRVIDDCGVALNRGSVVLGFSNGDPPLSAVPSGDGNWSVTWDVSNTSAAGAVITARARSADGALAGFTSITGGVVENLNPPPSIGDGGVLSAASFALRSALAPGAIVSIFGASLAEGLNVVTALPLPDALLGVSAMLGVRALPLIFTSTGQVNAVIPIDAPANATQQLVVVRGTQISTPEPVVIAAAQPGVFTTLGTGQGQGHVYRITPAFEQVLAGPAAPVGAGDVLVIYCGGLGATNPAVAAGTQTPLSPLAPTVNAVTVLFGDVEQPAAFAGLTPGSSGLYQVNVAVPAGTAKGNAVPLRLRVAGQESPAVTLAIQ